MEPVAKCFQKSLLRNTGYGTFIIHFMYTVYACTVYGEIFMVVKFSLIL